MTTAGNASGRNDGAAFVLMMSAEKAEELGYKPIARWVTGADVGVDPEDNGDRTCIFQHKVPGESGSSHGRYRCIRVQ